MSFQGLRVIAFESRRAVEIAELIRRKQGDAFVAPSMREVPLDDNHEAFAFAARLFAGAFDMMILLTGVGTGALNHALAARYEEDQFAEALRGLTVVARGPKPAAALREMRVPVTVLAPEPNTWREVLASTEGRPERRIAVQEYGKASPELLDGLRKRGAEVSTVRIYRWDLPEDTAPLREAAHRIARREAHIARQLGDDLADVPGHAGDVAALARLAVHPELDRGLARMADARGGRMSGLEARLDAILRATPGLMHVMRTARDLDLPDWLIFSGAIYQPVWNHLTGRDPAYGIKDYDLAYFDATDLSYEAEDVVIKRLAARFHDLPLPVQARNQARVHLWFPEKFGVSDFVPLTSSAEMLERYASKTHAVGARLEADGAMRIVAPFGLDDICSFRVVPNPVLPNRPAHEKKGARAKSVWPEITVVPWPD